ncbi:MAG: pyrroloquinoline quinone-dependent dehydrogenase [Gemmatimonadota bacterium]
MTFQPRPSIFRLAALPTGLAVTAALVAALGIPAESVAQSAAESAPPTSDGSVPTGGDWEPITGERLLHPEDGDWMSYRRTYDVTGFSPLKRIDRSNVDRLDLVWAYSMRDDSRWVPTPVVANGLMYVAEGSGRVMAFDVVSGDVAWSHERRFPEDIRYSEASGRARGVAVYQDRIYWGTADSYLVALDARTGERLWEVQTGDYHTGEGHAHPPLIVDGKVLLGHAGGDYGAKGKFRALDAETGEILWTFNTVPEFGEPGWDSWNAALKPPAGGAPWNTISYDPELGLVYVGTGQPYPWASTLRGSGDALYTNSVLALHIDTGELEWHYQLVPEDNWDRAVYESMLLDLEIGGEMRRALVTTSKIGWGVVLDRETGEFLHAFRTGFDNVITGWTDEGRPVYDPEKVPHQEDVDSDKVFEVCPHYHGGRNLNSPSYSPRTGLYYLGFNNSCMDVSYFSEDDPPSRISLGMSGRPKPVPGLEYVGELIALDPATGERKWAYRTDDGVAMTAATLATAGDLVFGGTVDREVFALDAESGEKLWSTRLNGDVSGAPVTFEVGGRQYLAVGAGGRIAQAASFAPFTDTALSDGGGVIWVFALPE